MEPIKLYLAPMEGVTDFIMRDLLTSIGGIDYCVTEFVRVTDQLLPDKVFLAYCPELTNNSKTSSGTPLLLQLLGGQVNPMVENALQAVKLGARGIDLNFGCPAKIVNRHDGGAALLKSPQRIYDIVKAIRLAIPATIPVTAKIRLGFDSPLACIENTLAIQEAGANWITIHCRTKTDMYKPPAYWEWIARIKEHASIKIVANGDIATIEDFAKCKQITQCSHFMIGRGALTDPFIFLKIKGENARDARLNNHLLYFFELNKRKVSPYFAVARTKQWLRSLSYKELNLQNIFNKLKVINNPAEFEENLLLEIKSTELAL